MNFWERLDAVIASRSSRKAVADYLGVAPNTFSNWKARQSYPDAEVTVKIASFLKVSVEYLVTGVEPLGGWVEENKEFIRYLKILKPEQLKTIKDQVEIMVSEAPKVTKLDLYRKLTALAKYRDMMEPHEREDLDRDLERLRLEPEVQESLASESVSKKASGKTL